MELVRFGHRDPSEGGEISVQNRFGDGLHPFGHDVLDAVREQRGGLDGPLHTAGGGGVFLIV